MRAETQLSVEDKMFFEKIGAVEIWYNLSMETLHEHKASLSQKMIIFSKEEYLNKCLNSTSHPLYPGLVENGQGVAYLGYRVPLRARRLIAQIRLVYNNRTIESSPKTEKLHFQTSSSVNFA